MKVRVKWLWSPRHWWWGRIAFLSLDEDGMWDVACYELGPLSIEIHEWHCTLDECGVLLP